MATPAQIEANRRNAQNSTGPKTEEGKASSRVNRLSHGFTSSVMIIPGEDREEYQALLADLTDEFQPATPTEQIYVEKMVQNQWNGLRAIRFQSILLQKTFTAAAPITDLALLIRYHQAAERGFDRAHTELVKAQKEREKSQIGFESQTAEEPVVPPAETPADPPQPTAPDPTPTFESICRQAEIDLQEGEAAHIALRERFPELKALRKVA